MKLDELKELIESNREIEFKYNNSLFSITYSNEDIKNYISVCEFYKEPVYVSCFDEVIKLTINGITLDIIFSKLKDEDIYVY